MSKIGHGESLPPLAVRSIAVFATSADFGKLATDTQGLKLTQASFDAPSPGTTRSVPAAFLESARPPGIRETASNAQPKLSRTGFGSRQGFVGVCGVEEIVFRRGRGESLARRGIFSARGERWSKFVVEQTGSRV